MGFVESGTTGSLTSGKKDFVWNLEANGTFQVNDSEGNVIFKVEESSTSDKPKVTITNKMTVHELIGITADVNTSLGPVFSSAYQGSGTTAECLTSYHSDGQKIQTGAHQSIQLVTEAVKLIATDSYDDGKHNGEYIYVYGSGIDQFVQPSMRKWETSFSLTAVTATSFASGNWAVLGCNTGVTFGTGSGPSLTSGTDNFTALRGAIGNNAIFFPDNGYVCKVHSMQIQMQQWPTDSSAHTDSVSITPIQISLNSASAIAATGTTANSTALDDTSIMIGGTDTASALSVTTDNIALWKWPSSAEVHTKASAYSLDNTRATLGDNGSLLGADKLMGLGFMWKRNPGDSIKTYVDFNIKINYRLTE